MKQHETTFTPVFHSPGGQTRGRFIVRFSSRPLDGAEQRAARFIALYGAPGSPIVFCAALMDAAADGRAGA